MKESSKRKTVKLLHSKIPPQKNRFWIYFYNNHNGSISLFKIVFLVLQVKYEDNLDYN